MKDSVGKWYKDGEKDLNVIPPYEAWENVEKTMEDWPKHWYQSNFENLQSPADKASWKTLSQQLEVQHNAKVGRKNFVMRTASMVAAIVLLPIWLINVVPITTTNGSIAGSNSNVVAINTPHTQSDLKPQTAVINENSGDNAVKSTFGSPTYQAINTVVQQSTNNGQLATTEPNGSETPSSSQGTTVAPLETRTLAQLPNSVQDFALLSTSLRSGSIQFTEPNESSSIASRQWSLGPTAIIGSSSLLNPLSYRDDASTQSSFNVAYGVSVSQRFNNNRFTADLLFNDIKSQSVTILSEELKTQLSGITAALQYERTLPFLSRAKKLRPELSFGVGVFTSYLKEASVMSNVNDSDYSLFTYRNFDFGGVFSVGTSVQISNRLRFGVGARVQSGTINLFEGREKTPSKFFRTQSLVTGVQTKLSYMF